MMTVFGECFVSYAVCCLIYVVIYVREDAVPRFVFLGPPSVLNFWFQFSVCKPFETDESGEFGFNVRMLALCKASLLFPFAVSF